MHESISPVPMLVCFCVSILLYMLLPFRFNLDESKVMHLPKEIYLFHNWTGDILYVLTGMFRSYWYVWCILMYYVLFYTSSFLSKRLNISMTNVLLLLMFAYYIASFNIAGESYAHYYRLTWAFFCGHLFATMEKMPKSRFALYVAICILPSALFEARYMNFSFVLSVLVLLFISFLNKRFVFKSKILLFLGLISYFFYLVHRRIAWVVCCYLGIDGVVPWIFVSLIVSILVYGLYNAFKWKKQ